MVVDYVKDMNGDILNGNCEDGTRHPQNQSGRTESRFAQKPEPETLRKNPAVRKAVLLGLTAGLSATKFICCFAVVIIISQQLSTNDNAQTSIAHLNGNKMLLQAALSMPTALMTFIAGILTFRTYPVIPDKMFFTHTLVQVVLFFLDVAIIVMTLDINLPSYGKTFLSLYLLFIDIYSICLTQLFFILQHYY
ncbi:hypothetical protein Ocin01_04759 [Orchesella cincta]|uniref:Uncharacterized protein n=1 Tax=Orchesella cincta TaxID=48709 RepID=A0A1D2N9I8_ORCCI|nr:hypothetical protein Ocin01_04759 [Orchesella cincta]